MDIRQHQWQRLLPLLEELRPRKRNTSDKLKPVVNGLLWVIRTSESWAELPRRFASASTTYRFYRDLVTLGYWNRFLRTLAENLKDEGGIDITGCFCDGNYDPEKCRKFISAVLDSMQQLPEERDWRWYTLLFFLNVKPESAIHFDENKGDESSKAA